MDAIRRLRPVLACSAGLALFASAASAGDPCTSGHCYSLSECTTLDECEGGVCGSRGCGGHFGRSGICNKCGRQHAGFGDDDGIDRWSDEWYAMNGGPVASPQRYHAGKLWPPYPRPSQRPQCSTIYHAATYWPHPYNCWDRAWVKNVFAVQTANGWMQATTLCSYHFDAETQMLNESGRNQLRWILEQAPPQHRTVYVQSATDRASSQARQAAVETEAAEMAGTASAPIVVRPMQLAGRPANEVDALRRSELQTMPKPRLDLKSLGSGSGDGM